MICNLSLVHWASGTVKLVANLSGSTVSRAGHASYISAELGTPHTFFDASPHYVVLRTCQATPWWFSTFYHTSFLRSSYSHMYMCAWFLVRRLKVSTLAALLTTSCRSRPLSNGSRNIGVLFAVNREHKYCILRMKTYFVSWSSSQLEGKNWVSVATLSSSSSFTTGEISSIVLVIWNKKNDVATVGIQ